MDEESRSCRREADSIGDRTCSLTRAIRELLKALTLHLRAFSDCSPAQQ